MNELLLQRLVATEIGAARLGGIVHRLVRAPSFQTQRFEADPELQRFIGGTVRRETTDLGLRSPWWPSPRTAPSAWRTRGRVLAYATVRHLASDAAVTHS